MPKVVDHTQRRSQLSEIVVELIAEQGIEAATVRQIAKLSGYSKGVIEHYFNGKEELISAALEHINQRYEQRAQQATKEIAGLEALRKRIEATLPMTKAIAKEWRVRMVFWSMALSDKTLARRQAYRFSRAVDYFAADLRDAISMGEIAGSNQQAIDLGYNLFTTTIGISTVALYDRTTYNKPYLEQQAQRLITELMT